MIVIAVCNTKGGVGKTTLTAALAVRAAGESRRVALVDLDPQGSLAAWWDRRGGGDNPTIFTGEDTASDAVEALAIDGWDWVFIDTPPAFLQLVADTIEVADLVLIPMKASAVDLQASQDAVVMVSDAEVPHLVVLNDVEARWKTSQAAQDFLKASKVPVAETMIAHRASHVASMTVGKTAAEVNKGRDQAAAAEIDALWAEVKAAAQKAVRAKARKAKAVAHG